MKRDSDLITLSSKGQIVIPSALRQKLGLTPKTTLLAYGKKDTIVLKKIKVAQIYKDWGDVFDIMEKRKLTSRDIQKEIETYRREKRLR